MTPARRLQTIALLLTALSLLVVAFSAQMRLEEAGLGCADWPACYGRPPVTDRPYLTPLRMAHRLAASLSLLLTIYLVWYCRRSSALAAIARPANWLLGLMLALAVLGIWSGEPRRTAIVFLNLLGGLGLVSFSWRTFLATAGAIPQMSSTSAPPTLRFGALTLTMTVLLGAAIGAGHWALACPTFPSCQDQWWPSIRDWMAIAALSNDQPSSASGTTLHLLHRLMALISLLLLGHAAWTIWHSGKRLAAVLSSILLASTVATGIATLLYAHPLSLTTAHVMAAAGLLAAVATLRQR